VSKWVNKGKPFIENDIKRDPIVEMEPPEKETEDQIEVETKNETPKETEIEKETLNETPSITTKETETEKETSLVEQNKWGPRLLYFFAGLLSFTYLLNSEMNFYLTSDAESFALFSVKNELFWLSLGKAFIVLSGILISIAAKKKNLLYILSGYTLVVSIVVGWNNLEQNQTMKLQKQKETVLKQVEIENETLFEMKRRTKQKVNDLESRISQEKKYKETHLRNKAYGHVERCDNNINFLERKLTNMDKRYDEILTKIDSRVETIKSSLGQSSIGPSVIISFIVSIVMKLFALCIKIVAFSRLAKP
jgi:hypothetical protein